MEDVKYLDIPLGSSKDESGNQYGELRVLAYHGRTKGKARHPVFKCVCSCGTFCIVIGSNLRRGHTTSCGNDKGERLRKGLRLWEENHIPNHLDGKVFGDISVINYSRTETLGINTRVNVTIWNCLCSCGNKIEVSIRNLSDSSHCGCKTFERKSKSLSTHGMSKTGTYKTWLKMKERCSYKHYPEPQYYKNKDIVVCEEWEKSFEKFYEDMGERPEGHSLDRIDPSKGYNKDNCRWADYTLQAYNKTPSDNTSGRVGVAQESNGKYRAYIGYRNRDIHLGSNLSFEEACELRRQAEMKYYGFTKDNYMNLSKEG